MYVLDTIAFNHKPIATNVMVALLNDAIKPHNNIVFVVAI